MPQTLNSLTVTTWNLKNANNLIGSDLSEETQTRRRHVARLIRLVDPDVLCVQEGPSGEEGIEEFAAEVLDGDWAPILLTGGDEEPGTYDEAYEIEEFGDIKQWIWFLVKPELVSRCELQPPSTWQSFTGRSSWTVHYWGETDSEQHSHYRHPQVLRVDTGAESPIELIGVHLKSKINYEEVERDDEGNLVGDYLTDALKARIKMATEARDVRRYVRAKFNQVRNPGLVVMGDCNDGPGQDYFESKYLFFDSLTNLQGEILMAERFFNHALFDYPGHLRWTARFSDEITETPASENPLLLDHILMSQSLCDGSRPLEAKAEAGRVEHEVFERVNAEAPWDHPVSDHRPVTLKLSAPR